MIKTIGNSQEIKVIKIIGNKLVKAIENKLFILVEHLQQLQQAETLPKFL